MDQAILRGLGRRLGHGMAQRLGIHSLAEGVETEAEAEVKAARALGCTMAQGFLYDRAPASGR